VTVKDIVAFESHGVNGMVVDLAQFQADAGFGQDSGRFVKGGFARQVILLEISKGKSACGTSLTFEV
jgi:hypothetical protein